MSTSQTPSNDKERSVTMNAKQVGQKLIAPHPSVQDLGYARRIQLLNAIALILMAALSLGLLTRPQSRLIFGYMLTVSIISYLLGKTKYPGVGTFVFLLAFSRHPICHYSLASRQISQQVYT